MVDLVYLPTDEDAFEDIQDAMNFIESFASDKKDAIGWVIDVCEKVQPTHGRFINAKDIIYDMQNRASDEFSDYADDYLNDVEFDDEKINSLNSLLKDWFDRNSGQPYFWQAVKSVDSIIVDEELLEKYDINF